MKTSYSWYVFFFLLGGIAMVAAQNMLFVKATAQQPADFQSTPPRAANVVDGQIVTERRADGTIVQRTADGKILQTFTGRIAQEPAGNSFVPVVGPDGRRYYAAGPHLDPETAKLMNDEMQATQDAQKVLGELRSADSAGDKEKLKTQLREKLLAIFELQQKRRAAEVAKIEERLAKLKDTMKKRDTAKESIVDRRLDLLTGGVDELGWEETFPLGGPNAARGYPVPNFQPYGVPNSLPPSVLPAPALEIPATTVPRANTPAVPVPRFDSPPPAAAPAPAPAAPAATPAAPRR